MRDQRRKLILLSTAVALALGPIALRAQDAPTTPSPQPTTQPAANIASGPLLVVQHGATSPTSVPTTQISLNFQDAPIDTVLERLSDEAGFIILKPGPAAIPGRMTARSTQPISADEAVKLLNTVLMNNGYTAIQMGRILKIESVETARKGGIPVFVSGDPNTIEPTDELITQVIPLRTLDAVKLKTDLQPLIPVNADIASNAASNSIIITDTKANIKRIVEIIASMDKRDALENSIKVRQLKYADATAAAKLITDIFKPDSSSGGAAGGNPFAGGPGAFFRAMRGGGPGGPGGGGPGGGDSGDSDKGQTGKITASADTRTNTVVVTGPTDTLAVIDQMLDQLDADPSAQEDFFIYPVRNGQAVDIQGTLNSLFGNGTTGTTSSNTNTNNNAFGSTSTFGGSSGGSAFGGGSRGGNSGGGLGSSGGTGLGSSSFGSSASNGNNRGGGGFGGGGFGGGASAFGGQTSGPVSPVAELKGQVYVVADADTNSLLVATASKFDKQVREILAQLDRPIPQVLIKVLIAEVSHDDSLDAGIDFSVLNLRKSGNGQTGGTIFGNALAATAAQSTGNGGLILKLAEDNLTATLRALQNGRQSGCVVAAVYSRQRQSAGVDPRRAGSADHHQLADHGHRQHHQQYFLSVRRHHFAGDSPHQSRRPGHHGCCAADF
jgi:general secretion pathway protein D